MKDTNKITCSQRYQYQHGENILKKYSIQEKINDHQSLMMQTSMVKIWQRNTIVNRIT